MLRLSPKLDRIPVADWYGTAIAARVLGISTAYVVQLCNRGVIACHKLPGSKYRKIRREELVRHMRANNYPEESIPPSANSERAVLVIGEALGVKGLLAGLAMAQIVVHTVATFFEAGAVLRPGHSVVIMVEDQVFSELELRALRARVHEGQGRVTAYSPRARARWPLGFDALDARLSGPVTVRELVVATFPAAVLVPQ